MCLMYLNCGAPTNTCALEIPGLLKIEIPLPELGIGVGRFCIEPISLNDYCPLILVISEGMFTFYAYHPNNQFISGE